MNRQGAENAKSIIVLFLVPNLRLRTEYQEALLYLGLMNQCFRSMRSQRDVGNEMEERILAFSAPWGFLLVPNLRLRTEYPEALLHLCLKNQCFRSMRFQRDVGNEMEESILAFSAPWRLMTTASTNRAWDKRSRIPFVSHPASLLTACCHSSPSACFRFSPPRCID